MSMKEKLHTGELYLPGDGEILAEQFRCLDRLYDFNQTRPTEMDRRQALMREMFAEVGENCYIEPPFHANFGGAHVHLGRNVYMNFGVTMVDDTHIYVGAYTMFGPRVTVATAGHPILPELREEAYQYNMPVQQVAIIGSKRAVCTAIHNTECDRRNTRLGERIIREYNRLLEENKRQPENGGYRQEVINL